MKLTVHEVMGSGEILLASDPDVEHVVSWNQGTRMRLWIETNGWFTCIDQRTLKKTPQSVEEAFAKATRFLLNLSEEGGLDECIDCGRHFQASDVDTRPVCLQCRAAAEQLLHVARNRKEEK